MHGAEFAGGHVWIVRAVVANGDHGLAVRDVEHVVGRDKPQANVVCAFRSIRPVIPTTSGHLYRGIRSPLLVGCEA